MWLSHWEAMLKKKVCLIKQNCIVKVVVKRGTTWQYTNGVHNCFTTLHELSSEAKSQFKILKSFCVSFVNDPVWAFGQN